MSTDPGHPRKVLIIEEREARLVRRIFQEYIDGAGLR
jgi:hypothetical protein